MAIDGSAAGMSGLKPRGHSFSLTACLIMCMAIAIGRPFAGNSDATEIPPQESKDVYRQGLLELEKADLAVRANPDSLGPHLDRLRILFVLGVKKESFLSEGETEAGWLATRAKSDSLRHILLAYRGAFRVTHAKHGFNLNRKWENLKAGIPILDSAVALAPAQPEVRYLRLVSNYYLPFFMGRKPRVKEDFAALAALLPDASRRYPPKWFLNVAGFVLEKGDLPGEEEARLALCVREVGKEARQ